MAQDLGFLMVSYVDHNGWTELMASNDFHENLKKYESSAVIPVHSQKVQETEAGQVTTTLVVSSVRIQ
jgi:hypothetical protein